MLDAQNRVIMVSGANRGIGLATAELLIKKGYLISLAARNPDEIPIQNEIGKVIKCKWDAKKKTTSKNWVNETLSIFNKLDGVVMNAGVELGGDLDGDTEEEFDEMFEVNFKGPLRLVRETLPALRKSGSGRIVNVVSLAGKRPRKSKMLGYSASKFAAMSLTNAIRLSGWDDGVRATSVCPGMVKTRMTEEVVVPDGHFKMEPDVIAQTIAYALSLPNSAAVAEILVNSRLEDMF